MNKDTCEIQITGSMRDEYAAVLSTESLAFIGSLTRKFQPELTALMEERVSRQAELDAGMMPDFLASTLEIRNADWKVTDIPNDLCDRRVEITGPTDRKMIINALNSGAKVFMADCEDSLAPTGDNILQGQVNLRDAVNRTISLESNGKQYQLDESIATLIVRPRGLHLPEKHLLLDGIPVPGAWVDFGLYLFNNAAALRASGTGPYFYLPKLESHLEARLWASVFRYAEELGIVGRGEIKVTVLIETILAAFEIDEILYELRDYIVGMNCGRWDYIFSFIKKFSQFSEFVLPDRSEVAMTTHFLRSYSRLVIKTCHRRGAYAVGGMAAQIPIKGDPDANEAALEKVREDKRREVEDGHDGTWVAHPALVPIAMEVFAAGMSGPNQLQRLREDVQVCAADLLQVPRGKITAIGLRENISIAVQYLAAWLAGNGCVPINNLMEDAATAEISRAQTWQWIHHPTGILDEGKNVTFDLFKIMLREEVEKIRLGVGSAAFDSGEYRPAARILEQLTAADKFEDFLTSVAYASLD